MAIPALVHRLAPTVSGEIDLASATYYDRELLVVPLDNPSAWPYRLIWRLPDQASDDVAGVALETEDGVVLGPADSMHEDIAAMGGGRFSIWRGTAYISVPPGHVGKTLRWQGRGVGRAWLTLASSALCVVAVVISYRQLAPWKLIATLGLLLLGLHFLGAGQWLVQAAFVLLTFSAWIAPPRTWWPAIAITALPWIVAVLAYVFTVWGAIVLSPDSVTYLGGWASRSPGIYWIASALNAAFGSLDAFGALQGLVVIGAGVLAGLATFYALRELVGSRGAFLLGGMVACFVATSEQVWAASPQCLTEALTTAGLLASLSLLFVALRRADDGRAFLSLVALAATALGLAILVRTTAVLAAPVLFVFLVRLSPKPLRAAAAFALPIVAALLLQCGWNQARHGFFGLPLLSGAALLGNVAPLMEPGDSARHPRVSAQISAYVDEIGARIDWNLPFKKRCEVTTLQYNQLLWRAGGAWDAVAREVSVTGTPEGVGVEVYRNAVANTVAWECIARHKGEYAQFVADHFVQLYRYSSTEFRSYVRPMETSIAAEHWAVAPADSYVRKSAPGALFLMLDTGRELRKLLLPNYRLNLLATAMIPILVLALGRKSPPWLVLPAIGLAMTALYLAGTAFYQVALDRYILPIQPILYLGYIVLIAGIAGSIGTYVAKRRASGRATVPAALG